MDDLTVERAGVRRVPVREEHRAVVGADLGQSMDHTAVAVVERRVAKTNEWAWSDERHNVLVERDRTTHVLRALKRLPLGTPYPDQVAEVAAILRRLPLPRHSVELVIDQTGVGRPIYDLFEDEQPIGVTITGGDGEHRAEARQWRVSKLILVSRLEAALHTGELRIARDVQEAETLRAELRDFQRHVTAAGNAKFEARTGAHDDLVLAVALATWWATRPLFQRRMLKLSGW